MDWEDEHERLARARLQRPFSAWFGGAIVELRECVLQVEVAKPAVGWSTTGGRSVAPRTLGAIIDTGCTTTAIRADVAAELGLPPIGIVEVRTASSGDGSIPSQTVLASLCLRDPRGRELNVQCELVVQSMYDEMLLGMDRLAGGVLTVDLVQGLWDWKCHEPLSPSMARPPR
jgi:hypothetical protein